MQTQTSLRLSRRSIAGFAVVSVASAALLVLLLMRLIAASHVASSAPTSPLVGHPAPDFTVTVWNGTTAQTIHLADLKGKPVIVNFWASWCAPCAEEQPILEKAYQQYASRGIEMVGIAFQDKQSDGTAFLQQHGVTYPCGVDAGATAPVDYGVTGVPETVMIDRHGTVVQKFGGPIDDGSLDHAIQSLLNA